jgi:hypothetical protein
MTSGAWASSDRDAAVTLDHLRHSPNCSIAKARTRLGFAPRFTSLAAVKDALTVVRRTVNLQADLVKSG